jgi:plastocyanin
LSTAPIAALLKGLPHAWFTVALALLAVAVLAGCATDSASPPPAATSTPASEPSAASPTPTAAPSSARPTPATSEAPKVDATVDVVVANGRVTPNAKNVRVGRGDRVRFTINSDVDESIHIHGYDLTAEVRPGKPGAVTFVAD